MARYNEILTGRYNRLIQKLLSMKGSASLVSVDDSMQAVLALFHGVENRYLEAWARFGVSSLVAAVVGQNSVGQIRNPATSNVVIVIEKLEFSVGVTDSINIVIGPGITDLSSTVTTTASRFDSRGNPNPTAVVTQGNNIALALLQIAAPNLLVSTTLEEINHQDEEITLLPGDGLRWQTQGVNNALRYSIWWRERLLEESERA